MRPNTENYYATLAGDKIKQVAQLSQRDRAAGWVSYGQMGDNILRTLYGLSLTTMT